MCWIPFSILRLKLDEKVTKTFEWLISHKSKKYTLSKKTLSVKILGTYISMQVNYARKPNQLYQCSESAYKNICCIKDCSSK